MFSKRFKDVLEYKGRYLIAWGGRGSGKTEHIIIKLILETFQSYYVKIVYVNKEKSNLTTQQFASFRRVIKKLKLENYFTIRKDNHTIINNATGNLMIGVGMDDPEKSKGIDNPSIIWWDEINKGNAEDFQALNKLLRYPEAKYFQFIISFNPVSERNWLRNYFFSKEDKYKLNEQFINNSLNHRSTYKDNDFIDQNAYHQTLLDGANGNENALRVDINGEWGIVTTDDLWLHALKSEQIQKKVFVNEIKYIPTLPIYISFDFNNDPYTCIVAQMSLGNHKSMPNAFVHILELIQVKLDNNNPFKVIANHLRSKYNLGNISVTGDASGFQGKAGLIGGARHNYDLIANELNLSQRQIKTPLSNPLHSASRVNCNALLISHINYKIDATNCEALVNDMLTAIASNSAKEGKGDEIVKDRGVYKNDALDAWRYFNWTYLDYFGK